MGEDLPPELIRLPTLETWAAHYLTRIRARIAAVERQQAQQPPGLPAAPPVRPAAGSCPYAGLGPGGGRYRGPGHGDPPGRLLGPGPVTGARQRGVRPRRAGRRCAAVCGVPSRPGAESAAVTTWSRVLSFRGRGLRRGEAGNLPPAHLEAP